MSLWEEHGNEIIIAASGLMASIAAWHRDKITNKVTKNQDKRDEKTAALTASEQAVNIMQDVLETVNAAREADKVREDECHKALAQEREERKKEVGELRDMVSRLENVVELYRKRVVELETKFGQA